MQQARSITRSIFKCWRINGPRPRGVLDIPRMPVSEAYVCYVTPVSTPLIVVNYSFASRSCRGGADRYSERRSLANVWFRFARERPDHSWHIADHYLRKKEAALRGWSDPDIIQKPSLGVRSRSAFLRQCIRGIRLTASGTPLQQCYPCLHSAGTRTGTAAGECHGRCC